MRIKRIKRKCMVSGCKNTATYHITKRNEFGNSIHICADCLREAGEMILDLDKEYVCPECGRVYKTDVWLRKHILAVHNG